MGGPGFPIIERRAAPAELVAPAEPAGRLAVFCYPTSPAVVAGSTQKTETLDLEAIRRSGAELVKRRSGGGAVYVAPGAQVWLDVYLPARDPLHTVDVSRAACFVGEIWKAAMVGLVESASAVEVYSGPLMASRWWRSWCYSGLGPGEVTLDGRKLVGLSQRRNRDGTWFFTMGCCSLDPVRDAGFLAASDLERGELAAELHKTLVPLPAAPELIIEGLKRSLALT